MLVKPTSVAGGLENIYSARRWSSYKAFTTPVYNCEHMNEIYVFICGETEIYALLYFLHSQKIAPTHRPTTFINHKQNHVYASARAAKQFHFPLKYTTALFSKIFKSSEMEGGVKASLERGAKNGSFAPKCSDFVNFGPHYLQRRGTTYSVTRSVAGARADQQRGPL